MSAMAKANMDKKKRERFLKDIEQSKVKIKEEEAKEDEIDGVEVRQGLVRESLSSCLLLCFQFCFFSCSDGQEEIKHPLFNLKLGIFVNTCFLYIYQKAITKVHQNNT